jgi:hypothetical protein
MGTLQCKYADSDSRWMNAGAFSDACATLPRMSVSEMRILVFPSGWGYVQVADEHPVRIQVVEAPGGRLVIQELHVAHLDGVSSDRLRALPIARIEAALNSPDVGEDVRARLDPIRAQEAEQRLTAFFGEVAPEAHKPLAAITELSDLPGTLAKLMKDQFKVRVPEGRTLPDSFYRHVAAVYSSAAQWSRSPAVDVAEANDVPVSRVHRWVKEARRRGLLPPGQRSRKGTGS